MVELGVPGIDQAVEIGRGGFGVVYRARQEQLGRYVAVKVLNARLTDERARARFEREGRALGSLSGHPHVVGLYEFGITSTAVPYLVLEYLADGSLADRLRDDGAFDVDVATQIAIQIAGALQAAHDLGVIHCDVKPENVLLGQFGTVKLGDFGIAQLDDLSASSSLLASPAHAAPEVLNGDRATVQSDVYGLGSTLYALLAGHAAFIRPGDSSIYAVIARVGTEPPPDLRPDGVPEGVWFVLSAAMSKNPDDRPSSAAAFADALGRARMALGLERVTPLSRPATGRSSRGAPVPIDDEAETIGLDPGLEAAPSSSANTMPTAAMPGAGHRVPDPAQAAMHQPTEALGAPSTTVPAADVAGGPAANAAPARSGSWGARLAMAATLAVIVVFAGIALALRARTTDSATQPPSSSAPATERSAPTAAQAATTAPPAAPSPGKSSGATTSTAAPSGDATVPSGTKLVTVECHGKPTELGSISTSPDGRDWKRAKNAPCMNHLTFIDGRWVGYNASKDANRTTIWAARNGEGFEKLAELDGNTLGLGGRPGQWLASVERSGSGVGMLTSADGVTWRETPVTVVPAEDVGDSSISKERSTNTSFHAFLYVDDGWVACNDGGWLATSKSGEGEWSSSPALESNCIDMARNASAETIMVGYLESAAISKDLLNWLKFKPRGITSAGGSNTPTYAAIVWSDGRWYMPARINDDRPGMYTSTDGITWTPIDGFNTAYVAGMAASSG